MNNYLQAIGLLPADNQQMSELYVYHINNPDGSPRWIWNATCAKPLFLGFYAASSWKAKLFSLAFRILFLMRLQHVFFKSSRTRVINDPIHPLSNYLSGDFAVFTGTEGPNRKLVVYAGKKGEPKKYIKVAISPSSEGLIANEYKQLQLVGQGDFFRTPEAELLAPGILSLEDMRHNGKRSTSFSLLHAKAITEIMRKSELAQFPIHNSPASGGVSMLDISDTRIPDSLVLKLKSLSHELDSEVLLHAPAHADFTPWNCFNTGQKLHLYDFELAGQYFPLGFDAFHFVMQQSIFVDHLSWKEMKPRMLDAFDLLCKTFKCTSEQSTSTSALIYLRAYLLVNISYYLRLYAKQEKWHTQVYWQFSTWNDALSDLLAPSHSPRKLLIGDLFSTLRFKSFAALKFPDIQPEELSGFADIDLLMYRQDAVELAHFMSHHSLVQYTRVQYYSHMISMQLVLRDSTVLAVDLIWKLKRRSIQFMNTQQTIENAVANSYGVKQMSVEDTKNYLIRFYGLNYSEVPERYHSFFEERYSSLNFKEIQEEVRSESVNKGLSGIINTTTYMKDTINTKFKRKGIVVTFSGVDGAGKSTVLEQVRFQIEKKIRQNVVVIRHRPSLLPILSAFTYGKEKAEQRAASTLPRQGNNKSTLSSLLRFAYYYSDYLFGQFYIWIKYTSRGTVVLYDRYYFDFINDSVRSNIRLPKWIMKAGYALIIQPHLNFFLYADAATILQRKKELDEETITKLTHEYLTLFGELSKRGADHYFPIENIELEDTVSFIIGKVQEKLLR